MNRAARAAATGLLIALAGTAAAQPATPDAANLRGDSAQTRKRLAEIKAKLETGSVDAGDELQQLVDEVGDDLVTADGKRFVSARRAAHALLAQLPADALKAHRDRTEVPARALLERARAARDPRALWALVDRYPVSGPADEGLLLLGELLFERGEFRTAEGVWRRLLPDGGADVPYPGSKSDPARVRALVALAAIYQNEPARARELVEAFKAKHAGARGPLAGKTGPYIDALEAQLAAAPALPPDATAGAAWPTFGGAPERAGRVPAGLPHFPARPTFTKALPDALARGGGAPARPPYGYPVIAGGEVFVSDGNRVFAFDRTGEPSRARYTHDPKLRDRPASEPDASAALTVAGGRLYARLGAHAVAPPTAAAQKADSYLVCLGLSRPGKLDELWKLAPPESARAPCAWEGAPLVSGRRLWAVYTKFDAGRAVRVLACYDPADADEPPARPAWAVELCDAPAPAGRTRQDLLTLAGRHVVFCSNSGAAVAVDATTGKRAWAVRYPRARKQPVPSGDAAPALAHAGRVFLVPADADRALALDAETGRVLWESAPLEGARALGVSRDRLVVAASGPARGIRALNAQTGAHDDGGWVHETPELLTYGQALVAENVILWPTRNGLFHLKPENGRPLFAPRTGPGGDPFFGHLACADGLLAVVTPTHLWLYEAEAKPAPPDSPRNRYDVLVESADALARAGSATGALARLVEASGCAVPSHLQARALARAAELAPPGPLPVEVRAELLSEWLWDARGVPITLGDLLDARAGKDPRPLTLPDVVLPRKPCVAAFDPEAELAHTVSLPPAVRPLLAIPGGGRETRAFASGARAGLAVPFDRSEPRAFVPADLFTHAAELGTGFVCAGPFAVALYGEAKEAAWVFRVPLEADGAAPPHLGSFALAGRWLFARLGERHLIALDLSARRAAWVLGANGNAGYEPDAHTFPNPVAFGPHFALTGGHLVAQCSNGKRWFVSARTGTVPALAIGSVAPTARAPWAVPPEPFAGARAVVADGPGTVRLTGIGRAAWRYEPNRAAGLTGEPAHARAFGAFLYVAVRRNHGVEVERVDPADGAPAWARGPAFADADRTDLRAADADEHALYVPAGNQLLAVCHETGRAKWEAELPAGRAWTARAAGAWVVCVPAEAAPDDDFGDVLARCGRALAREPLVARLPGLAVTLYDALVSRAAHVRVFDADTGAPVRGWCVPARGPDVRAWCDAGALVVATGDRVVWFK